MRNYTVVDAFAESPLAGNPVAVFFRCDDLDSEQLQRIAREMNLSETTFVLPPTAGGDWQVRIFTPVNELPFAGHPLLGTAIALSLQSGADQLHLETKMGIIPIRLDRSDEGIVKCTMDQPVPVWSAFVQTSELLDALSLSTSTTPVEVYTNGPRHVFVGLQDVSTLSRLSPDHRKLSQFPDLAVNCFAPAGDVWRNRMFSPAYGVVEDAATGSAAGPLVVHLQRHGSVPFGKRVEIHQGVEMGRPSRMYADVDWLGNEVIRVQVSGSGVKFADGVAYV